MPRNTWLMIAAMVSLCAGGAQAVEPDPLQEQTHATAELLRPIEKLGWTIEVAASTIHLRSNTDYTLRWAPVETSVADEPGEKPPKLYTQRLEIRLVTSPLDLAKRQQLEVHLTGLRQRLEELEEGARAIPRAKTDYRPRNDAEKQLVDALLETQQDLFRARRELPQCFGPDCQVLVYAMWPDGFYAHKPDEGSALEQICDVIRLRLGVFAFPAGDVDLLRAHPQPVWPQKLSPSPPAQPDR